MRNLIVYHGNCADGFTAAWAAWRANPRQDFVPAVYGQPFDIAQCAGRHVYFLDFCLSRDQMAEITHLAESLTILDHHKTAVERMVDFHKAANPGCHLHIEFDMDRSGARMAWEFFHPNSPLPDLVAHVEDRDLWRFALPGTRAYQAAVFSFDYTFKDWDRIAALHPSVLIADGEAIERKHFKDIRELIASGKRTAVIGGHEVPVLNVPYMLSSDAGHIMAEDAPFAACYWDADDHRRWSLRSRPDGIDVSEIAKQYGGGGHRNAAGFESALDWLGDWYATQRA